MADNTIDLDNFDTNRNLLSPNGVQRIAAVQSDLGLTMSPVMLNPNRSFNVAANAVGYSATVTSNILFNMDGTIGSLNNFVPLIGQNAPFPPPPPSMEV